MTFSPPITVGELTDVPSPRSAIVAPFHQEVANRVVHRFATVGAMNASNLAAGSLAVVDPAGNARMYRRVAAGWANLGHTHYEVAGSQNTIGGPSMGIAILDIPADPGPRIAMMTYHGHMAIPPNGSASTLLQVNGVEQIHAGNPPMPNGGDWCYTLSKVWTLAANSGMQVSIAANLVNVGPPYVTYADGRINLLMVMLGPA